MKDNFATAKVHYLSKMTKKKQDTDSKIKRLLRLLDIDIAIKKFSLHPSIIRIQSNTKYTERFSFSEVSIQQVAPNWHG